MYRLLVSSGESQAIIVSGPSGSGKTETCKYVLRHLAFVSKHIQAAQASKTSEELGRLLVLTNPLLEAFGNAETVLNKNSSRFGKFVQVIVSRQGAILGASIQTYLLETTRVVMHAQNECSYHINYQLVLGASSSERASYQLENDPNKYAYLRSGSGQATKRRGEDPQGFQEVVGVLDLLRVGKDLKVALFQTLSGLLSLGSVKFHENANGDSSVQGLDELKRASALLGTNIALLQQALCSRTMKVKGTEMQIPLKVEESKSSRDALGKAVYLKLFGWVVAQVNGSLLDSKVQPSEHCFLGILDIYGFENFEKNSLEQLFINFTNEQLHQHFAISLFKTEQEIYAAEGIVWPGVEWEDNSECIEVIAGKSPNSIFNSLTEHSRLPNSADAKMTEALLTANRKSKVLAAPKLTSGTGRTKGNRLTQKEAFVVQHFAGEVCYRTEGWLSKNTDSLHEDLSLCMSSSESLLLAQLFQQGSLVNAIGGGRSGGSRRAGFVADKYARQLEILMLTLRSTHSHFVRCIKPNHEQVPRRFVNELCLSQLLNSGMVDAVRLLSAGYPTRVSFDQLERQFKPLAPAKFQRLSPAMFSAALLTAFDLSHKDFLLGLTRAFFKSGKLAFVDSLAERAGALDQKFWVKMARLLSLWRLRRGIAAVRCLIFLEAKMRRLRAMWKFRRSANVANLVGRSWVRRANEIRYGRAIEVLQAFGRGFTARHLRTKKARGVEIVQKMGRGYLARIYRDKLRVEREVERKAKAKADRERKIRERKEAMERKEQQAKEQQASADAEMRERKKAAAARAVGGGAGGLFNLAGKSDDDPVAAKPMAFKRKPLEAGEATGASHTDTDLLREDEEYLSEGSDLMAEESDDEATASGSANLQDPRALLAATAALDVRANRASTSGRNSQGSIPGLNLGGLSGRDEEEVGELERSGSMSARTLSMTQRGKASWVMRKTSLGNITPRSSRASGYFSSRGRALVDGRKLLVSKTPKGSLVAASILKVSKRAGESAQERFVLLVGDVLLIFMLAAQPEMPLPLRLWPAQLICLNQSTLIGAGGKAPDVTKDNVVTVAARAQQLGAIGLAADDPPNLERFALAMSLGVASVRRARQQAKLSLAQQLCHEKKLSLLKTQHMIDLLHKSQEMFFEAGSGQFDDCNAVCMHSGVMRQSLIDVTPFMPVSDFICEYCSCVIIPEEQCAASGEFCESKSEEHKQVVKKEQQRKLQLDDETLMLARDVRALRERRKTLEDDLTAAWTAQSDVMGGRQKLEAFGDRLDWALKVDGMSKEEIEKTRASLVSQIDAAKKARAQAASQLAARHERIAKRDQAADLEVLEVDAPAAPSRGGAASALGRRLSFSKKKKQQPLAAIAEPAGDATAGSAAPLAIPLPMQTASTQSKGSTITRVLSFGKRGKKREEDIVHEDGSITPREEKKKTSITGELVRKLSFNKKKDKQ